MFLQFPACKRDRRGKTSEVLSLWANYLTKLYTRVQERKKEKRRKKRKVQGLWSCRCLFYSCFLLNKRRLCEHLLKYACQTGSICWKVLYICTMSATWLSCHCAFLFRLRDRIFIVRQRVRALFWIWLFPQAPSTRIRIFSNPQVFLSRYGYRPHASGEFESESGKK